MAVARVETGSVLFAAGVTDRCRQDEAIRPTVVGQFYVRSLVA